MTYDSTQDLSRVNRILKYIVAGLGEQGRVVSKVFGWRFRLRFMGSMR